MWALLLLACLAIAVSIAVARTGSEGTLGPVDEPLPRDAPFRYVDREPDPSQQTALEFGDRSHWLQPLLAYADTPPAAALRSAIGVSLDVGPGQLDRTARLLAANGFARARLEVSWNRMDFERPDRLRDPGALRAALGSLRRHGLRPLILLNANHGEPVPVRRLSLRTVADAPAGARSVRLAPEAAGAVVPGLTGLDARAEFKAAATLITAVGPDGVATLSRPLAEDRPAGPQPGTTLRFRPFARPVRADGTPNPAFEATMAGWREYVLGVAGLAREALGPGGFDLEVWNELSFGSEFLDINTYYDPIVDEGPGDALEVTTDAILRGTIAAVRDPARDLGAVGVGNGFASQRPWDAGSTSPVGLTAIDKHPYPPVLSFPEDATPDTIRPLDALGRPSGTLDEAGIWRDAFVPRYRAHFPEHFLTAIQTEHLVRDLSPITTSVFGTQHGRRTGPPGEAPPQLWITEINLAPARDLPAAARARIQAKAVLRALVAYVHAGSSQVYLFAARGSGGENQIVSPAFFAELASGEGDPGDGTGGPTLDAVRRLADAVDGPPDLAPRPLHLVAVGDAAGRVEFAGDGTDAHPDLAHRDLVAALPFQADEDRWVVPAYVITRDLERVRRPDLAAEDPARHDLPAAPYRLELRGLETCDLSLGVTDPLDGATAEARLVECSPPRALVELPLTDSPRVLEIAELD